MKKTIVAVLAFLVAYSAMAVDDSMSPAKKKFRAKGVAAAKAALLETLKDPDSAKFRRITSDELASFVCGEVNAKNAMGGYVGYRRFYVIAESEIKIEGDQSFYDGFWMSKCGPGAEASKYQMK